MSTWGSWDLCPTGGTAKDLAGGGPGRWSSRCSPTVKTTAPVVKLVSLTADLRQPTDTLQRNAPD